MTATAPQRAFPIVSGGFDDILLRRIASARILAPFNLNHTVRSVPRQCHSGRFSLAAVATKAVLENGVVFLAIHHLDLVDLEAELCLKPGGECLLIDKIHVARNGEHTRPPSRYLLLGRLDAIPADARAKPTDIEPVRVRHEIESQSGLAAKKDQLRRRSFVTGRAVGRVDHDRVDPANVVDSGQKVVVRQLRRQVRQPQRAVFRVRDISASVAV